MNKADLIAEVAEKTGEAKTKVAEIVDATFDVMTDNLRRQIEVRIPNFGVFVVVMVALHCASVMRMSMNSKKTGNWRPVSVSIRTPSARPTTRRPPTCW